MKRLVSLVIATAVVLAGCTSGSKESEVRAGALTAARAYVDAIAAGDLPTVEEMTQLSEDPQFPGADVRGALPQVEDPITDTWVSVVSRTGDYQSGVGEYLIAVSYQVADEVGGATISLRIEGGDDPAKVKNWRVTEPLLATTVTGSRLQHASLGGVLVRNQRLDSTEVWGYPGGYLFEAEPDSSEVEPERIVLGVG